MTTPSSHIYSIDFLLPLFQKALDDKTASVQKLAASMGPDIWYKAWPEARTDTEKFAVDFLNSARDASFTKIATPHPLADAFVHGPSPCASVNHSLYMQIKNSVICRL